MIATVYVCINGTILQLLSECQSRVNVVNFNICERVARLNGYHSNILRRLQIKCPVNYPHSYVLSYLTYVPGDDDIVLVLWQPKL